MLGQKNFLVMPAETDEEIAYSDPKKPSGISRSQKP
jgi:hypothetical protein